MTKEGRVLSVSGNMAYIVSFKESSCGESCAHCTLNCTKKSIKFYAVNKIGAKAGDDVIVYANSKDIYLSSFLLYVLPVILVMASVILGSVYFKNDLLSLVFCALSLVLWVAVIKIINKKEIKHTVLKVVNKND